MQSATRQVIADFGADAKEVVFTSGATESNNMAIKGVANFYKQQRKLAQSAAEQQTRTGMLNILRSGRLVEVRARRIPTQTLLRNKRKKCDCRQSPLRQTTRAF